MTMAIFESMKKRNTSGDEEKPFRRNYAQIKPSKLGKVLSGLVLIALFYVILSFLWPQIVTL
jgi:hypothetical protein